MFKDFKIYRFITNLVRLSTKKKKLAAGNVFLAARREFSIRYVVFTFCSKRGAEVNKITAIIAVSIVAGTI